MMERIQLAFRNVLRNRRRTFLSTLTIAGGIAAMGVFQGLTHQLLFKMQEIVINTQFGHVQVASRKTWAPSADESPSDRLIAIDPTLRERINGRSEVAYTSGRISFSGLINNGEQSLSARGVGFDPAVETHLRETLRIVEGRNLGLGPDPGCEVILGVGLTDQIGVKAGGSVTLMAYTYDGAVNATDCQLVGIFHNGYPDIDNVFYLTLRTTQKFLGTEGFERLIVQLKDTEQTSTFQSWLDGELPKTLGTKTWLDLSVFFRQTVDFFKMQNVLIRWILMLLALLATVNTVSLSISERTGEIGTVRALGDSRGTVLVQFLIEGLIMGVCGGVLGCGLGFAAAKILNRFELPLTIPGSSIPVPLEVDILPLIFRDALLGMCVVAVIATLIPAYRASRLEITEALKRNV